MDSGDPSAGPHACAVGSFITETSPQLQPFNIRPVESMELQSSQILKADFMATNLGFSMALKIVHIEGLKE